MRGRRFGICWTNVHLGAADAGPAIGVWQIRRPVSGRREEVAFGDPLDETTDVGPLIRESDAIRADGMDSGSGARRRARACAEVSRKGSPLEPTVLTGTRPDMKVNCQEIFAPVVTVEPYADFNEAMRRINSSPYGLQAGIFTRDAKLMFQAFDELEVGGLPGGRCADVPH